jgi:glycosyltransferase involved in cell wall biosynthesis
MSGPKVSVVIPFYNCSYVNEALESALGQTYKHLEVIVVDDGSTVHFDKVKPYLRLPTVRCIRKINGGTASALNRGILFSRGDYFTWLSADDVMQPDKVEKQLNFMLENHAYFSHTAFSYINNQSVVIGGPVVLQIPDKRTWYHTLMRGCPINGSTVMIDKSVFKSVGTFDENLSFTHDYDMWLRIVPHYEFFYLNEPLTLYRVHESMGTKVHESTIPFEVARVRAKHRSTLQGLIDRGVF